MQDDILSNQSLFSLFPGEVLDSFPIYQSITRVDAGTTLVQEGELVNCLYVPVNCELKIKGTQASKGQQFINLFPGRSANLFSFLRSSQSQYSVLAETAGEVLVISRDQMTELFNKYPYVQNYLMEMTGNISFRRLSKAMDDLKIAKDILVRFLGSLRAGNLRESDELLTQNQQPERIFYEVSLTDPMGRWLGWVECVTGRSSQLTVKSTPQKEYFFISKQDLFDFKSKHRKAFDTIDAWIRAS